MFITRSVPDLLNETSDIAAEVSIMQREYSDLERACLGAGDYAVCFGVWSPVAVPNILRRTRRTVLLSRLGRGNVRQRGLILE